MRRLLRTGGLLLAAAVGWGGFCVGPSARSFERMTYRPGGVDVEVDVGEGRPFVSGELLEVRDTALLVHDTNRAAITLIPFQLVRGGRVRPRGTTWQGSPQGGTWDRLRLLSRFPYGLAAPQLQALLAAYGRDSLTVVR